MGLDEAFEQIVVTPFCKDRNVYDESDPVSVELAELRNELEELRYRHEYLSQYNGKNFDKWVREDLLEKAQIRCDTRCLALLYTYTYLYQHLDANQEVIRRECKSFFDPYIYNKPSNVLMVDVGCGPMTACLALADYHQRQNASNRLNLDYIGFDREASMTDIALEFGRRKHHNDLFGPNFRWCYPTVKSSIWVEQVRGSINGTGTLLFYFSYIFGQPEFSAYVDEWVERVKKFSVTCRVQDTYIVYLNIDLKGSGTGQGAYSDFKNKLRINSNTLTVLRSESGLSYKFRCPRRLVDVVDGRCSSLGLDPISRPHLNYEILRVSWKDYENSGT